MRGIRHGAGGSAAKGPNSPRDVKRRNEPHEPSPTRARDPGAPSTTADCATGHAGRFLGAARWARLSGFPPVAGTRPLASTVTNEFAELWRACGWVITVLIAQLSWRRHLARPRKFCRPNAPALQLVAVSWPGPAYLGFYCSAEEVRCRHKTWGTGQESHSPPHHLHALDLSHSVSSSSLTWAAESSASSTRPSLTVLFQLHHPAAVTRSGELLSLPWLQGWRCCALDLDRLLTKAAMGG